jgi:transaldolase
VTANEPTRRLHRLGQSLWLDGVSRPLLQSGALPRYIAELSVTGLRLDLEVFEHAIGSDHAYGDSIRVLAAAALSDEEQFFELALEDLTQAAELLRPIFDASAGKEGWVSLGISPLLADNAAHAIRAASQLRSKAALANLFVQIPGTPEGVRAIEEIVFDGIAVDVTLLFSPEHYLAAATAYVSGLERRLAAGLAVGVESVASVVVNRWDVMVKEEVSSPFHNRLGIAMAMRTYRAHHELLASDRWKSLAAAGARPQRLMWSGTGTHDATVPDTLYVEALAADGTIDCMPAETLLAFADHGTAGAPLPTDAGYADAVLEEFRREGVDDAELADRLQREGVECGAAIWHATLSRIREKGVATNTGVRKQPRVRAVPDA